MEVFVECQFKMNNKYIIENLTYEKLGTIFYVLKHRSDFYYDNLKEFFKEKCSYIDIYNIDDTEPRKYYYSLFLTKTKLNIIVSGSNFSVSFLLKDLILYVDEWNDYIYFKGKCDYNRDLHIPLYFTNCAYDSSAIKLKLDMETFDSLMELVSDYVIKDEDEE